MTFGEKLKQQRESRGIQLEEIAQATKIGSRYLRALEHDDFDSLPEDVFTKGFVRAVAEHIGSDPEALVLDYVRERDGRLATAAAEAEGDRVVRELARVLKAGESAEEESRVSRVSGKAVAVSALLVVLAVTVWWVAVRVPDEEPPVVAVTGPPPANERASAAPPNGDSVPAESRTIGDPALDPPATDLVERPVGEESPGVTTTEPSVAIPEKAEPRPEPPPPPKAPSVKASAAVKPPPPKAPSVKASDAVKPPPPKAPSAKASDAVKPPPPKAPSAKPAVVVPPPPKPSAPPPPKATAAPPPAGPLIVSESGIGTDVVGRGLVGRSERFREGTDVWFWTRVLRGKPGDTIRHVWIHEGHEISSVALEIGSGNWGTQSRRHLQPGSIGGWAVEARDAAGRVLARQAFVCEGGN